MDNEELPYRAPTGIGTAQPASSRDEDDYSTLLSIAEKLDDAIIALYKDFNAFKLTDKTVPLEVQIAARKEAFKILEPLQAEIHSAINAVEQKQEGK